MLPMAPFSPLSTAKLSHGHTLISQAFAGEVGLMDAKNLVTRNPITILSMTMMVLSLEKPR